MNWVDVLLIIGLVAGTLQGLRMGMVLAVVTVLGIVLGTVVAGQFHDELEPALDFLSNETVNGARIAAFAILFFATFLVLQLVGHIARTVVRMALTPMADASAGAALGLAATAILLGVVISVLANFTGGRFQRDIEDSPTAQFLVDKVPVVLGLLPDDFEKLDVLKRLR
jgi:uncharacterized membrane protein required for colicin V production